jgi:hypothetical protein
VTSTPDEHRSRGDREERAPLDQLVDQAANLFVYAPIGLFFEAPTLLPKLAEQGRVHVRNARLFGQFAVRHGEAELRRRVTDLEHQASGLLKLMGLGTTPLGPEPSGPADEGTASSAPGTSVVGNGHTPGAGRAASETEAPAPDVGTLAIPGYDSLSASQVVTRLDGLTPAELEAVRAYESAHRGRKTILNKVAQLQG